MNSLEKVAGGHFYISFCPWGGIYEKWARSLRSQRPRLTWKCFAAFDAKAIWMRGDRATIQDFSHVICTQNKTENRVSSTKKTEFLISQCTRSEVHNCQGEWESRLRGWSIAQRSHKASQFPISLSLLPICYSPFLPCSLGSFFVYPSLTEMPTANKLCMSQHKRKLSKR